jgi:hypothetical protein
MRIAMTDVKQRKKKEMPVSPGRPKGVPNKMTAEVKQMILAALEQAGGVEYLARQADDKPAAFLALVGKVMPLQVNGPGENGEFLFSKVIREVIDPSGTQA